MMAIEILKELEDNGKLDKLVKSGLVSTCVVTHMRIFYAVDRAVQMGEKRSQAICNAAAVYNVTPSSVYRVLKTME